MKKDNSIWSFFIRKKAITWLMIIGIIIAGSSAIKNLPRELQPEINIPFGLVSTTLPGASPEDTESLLTEPLEKQIASIADIKAITSTSGIGFSSIGVEFEANVDIDQAVQELKDAVDIAKIKLPDDASEPFVAKAQANSAPVINFSILGDKALHELTDIAEEISEELEAVSGVKEATVLGGQKKIVEILIDPAKAQNFNLSLSQITQLIKSQNNNLPLGIISSDQKAYSVRIDNQFKSIEEIRNLPLLYINETQILLSDIAKIEETFPENSVISKFSLNGEAPKQAVSIQIKKKDGSNLIAVVDNVKEKALSYKLPAGVEIAINSDNSQFIRNDLGVLTRSGIQTTILIILILFLALGLREGLIAGLSIPLTLLITFVILDLEGMSLNGLTLFSLVIALGLMVDTAIIIMEGIHDNIKKGLSSQEAAIKSVQTYKLPLIAGTMTTIFAFFPMLLVSGILGQFLRTLPITISAALFSSLFVSLTIGPALASKLMKNHKPKPSILAGFFNKLGTLFERLINKIVRSRATRIIIILTSITLFVGSLSLPATGILKVEMFPKTDIRFFFVDVETDKGTSTEKTAEAVAKIEAKLFEIPEIENFLSIVGSGQSQNDLELISIAGSANSNEANITVNLVEEKFRDRKSYEIAAEIRNKLRNFKEAKVTINELQEGPPSDAPIAIRITGDETQTLRQISSDLETMLSEIPGTENIRSSLEPGLSEFRFILDRNKVIAHGLNVAEINIQIRGALQGVEITELSIDGDDTKVTARYDFAVNKGFINTSINEIENIEIPTRNGQSIKLGQLGDYELNEGLASIAREDQERIVKVRSDLSLSANAVEVTKIMEEKISKYDTPANYNIGFGGDNEDIQESFQDLFQSMIVGVILIIFTLVLMFNSLRQPLIILFTVPLALIGVFPGLMSVGLKLSFPAFLGVVALTGIVVNDAIVLIDRINESRRKGMPFEEAIAESTKSRLQPIVITSITTIIGILPLAMTNDFWSGLGFSLIFGLAAATFLTLIVVPVLYYMIEPKQLRD
ncbi:efflux RND transporter permease subunit [Candidatus Gracilibacteria bacterium]|nr:efflux RND transporter permease subunit [Candidatus Gracilibacteria bacterium]